MYLAAMIVGEKFGAYEEFCLLVKSARVIVSLGYCVCLRLAKR
jgi:hypothetical protein